MNMIHATEPTPNNIVPLPKTPPVATVLPPQQQGELTNFPVPHQKEPAKIAITVRPCKVRGQIMWRVRYPENGEPRRAFRATKPEADALAAELRGQGVTNKQRLLTLPPARQHVLLAINDRAQERQIDLYRVLASLDTMKLESKVCPAAGLVVAALIQEKEDANRDEDYVKNLRQSLEKFVKGRELLPIDQFTTDDIKAYLRGKTPGYQKTLLPKLSMLFIYAKRETHITDNPCDRVPEISYNKGPVEVFHVDEAKKCLEWLVKNPKGLAWFIKTAFAGMRPQDEACSVELDKVDFKRKCIVVEAEFVKTDERRVCYAPDMVFGWLKYIKDHDYPFTLTLSELVTVQRKLRAVLGWPEWKQDVTRHSAATYWLASTSDAKRVSRSLGHSLSILDSTYDARKFEHEGLDYYGLTVDKFI